MGTQIYTRPTDSVLSTATASATSGTVDPDYPLANLNNGIPTLATKFTSQAATLLFDFGSAKSLELVALINSNLDAALNVRWQGNASNSWVSPSLDVALTIATRDLDYFVPGAYVDLSSISHSYRYWRLVVPTNSVNVILGELCAYLTKRTTALAYNGLKFTRIRQPVQHATPFGVTYTYDRGSRERRVDGTLTEADFRVFEQQYDASLGMAKPFLFVPDPIGANEAWLVRWAVPSQSIQPIGPSTGRVAVSLQEVSRGVAWLAS